MPPVAAAVSAIISSVAASLTTFGLAQTLWLAAKILVVTGSVVYNAAQARKAKRAVAAATAGLDQGRAVMVRDPIAPRRIVYGQVVVSGPVVFMHVSGSNNEYLHLVVKLADHLCEELGTIYFNGVEVPLDGSGNATGTFAGHARVKKFLGLVAGERDTDLETESGGIWTANHLGKEVARLHVRLKQNPDLFAQGVPVITCKVKGRKVYDPRTATTVWSANAALCAGDYLMDARYSKGVALARIVAADWIEAANICDENVVIDGGGTEDRYTCNGVITSDEDPNEILMALAEAMAGVITDIGGKWVIRAGAWRTPTLTLTDDDLIGSFSVAPRLSRQDTFNGVRGTYYAEVNQWAPADFPAIKNDTYKTWDGGVRLWRDVAYRFTTSPATAQRLAKVELERGRQQIIVSCVVTLKALQCQPGDVVYLTRSRLGWTNKAFEVQEWAFYVDNDASGNPVLGVRLSLRETASAVWDWANGEETTVDLADNTTLINSGSVATPGAPTLTSGSSTGILQPDGTTVPRLKVAWSSPADDAVLKGWVEIEYKRSADSTWLSWLRVRGDLTEDFITDVHIGVNYDVRIRFRNLYGVAGAWATTSAHTVLGDTSVPGAPSGLAAVVGTGKSVSLDWTDSTADDHAEYGVYRNTVNNPATATKIAETNASRFVDVDVALGTTYYYWVTDIDRSENESAKSSGVGATPSVVAGSSTDFTTVPSTPSAPTFVSEASYQAGDGAVFARITVSVPALPANAVLMNVLYRRSGASDWLVAAQVTGSGNVSIDDLSPGVAYEFAMRGISFAGVVSAVSSTLSRTAPNDSGVPATPSGLTAVAGTGKTIALDWNDNTEDDLLGYKVYRNTSNSFGGATYLAFTAASYFIDATVNESTQYYYWIKAIDRTGNESAESSSANATTGTIAVSSLAEPYFIADPAVDSLSGTNELIVQDASGVNGTTIYSRPLGQTTWDTTASNGSSTKRYLSVTLSKIHEAFVRKTGYNDSGVVSASFNDC